jgi:hypothetical protein
LDDSLEQEEIKIKVGECKLEHELKRKEVVRLIKEKFREADGDNLVSVEAECRELFERFLV